MESIREHHITLVEEFKRHRRSPEESKALLKKFTKVLSQSFDPLSKAIKDDFNKPQLEFLVAEFGQAISETNHIIANLDTFLKSEGSSSVPISFASLSYEIEKIALGTVLIISPFNYPLILALSPLVGAIAAGNNVVLKLPYDQLPSFCNALTTILESVFPSNVLQVVNGGVPEAQFVLNECKFDKIFFTGSTNVGKEVYKAASKNLTPVVLELGGKSPVFITHNVDLKSIDTLMDRLLWGKFSNAGQTCVAPDYVLIESSVYDKVMKSLIKRFEALLSLDENSDFSHIVNNRGFERLSNLLKSTKGTITGGVCDAETLFVSPTIVSNVNWDDPLMTGEIFGPILPVIKYEGSLLSVLKKVENEHDCPLAAYLVSSSKEDELLVRRELRSGALVINEFLMSAGCYVLPFGGIGSSGFGNYHGKWTINAFTHERAILKQPLWAEKLLEMRYYPYTNDKLKTFKLLLHIPEIPFNTLKTVFVYVTIFLIGWFTSRLM
ncbi:hypothetical protein CANINC_002608 [Pichia inconspicua]|uniref:Aldehyde dehydrogenase n=1 Tax=Pichia inconspicua TaxID=52247 RepID=A0A4T0X0P0_9ASCO|nr:hypothetical protein CANINC_002608 [[Candida] inconspicua]